MEKVIINPIKLIKSDFAFRCEYERKRLTLFQVLKFLIYPATIATILYRFQKFFYLVKLKPLAYFFQFFNSIFFTVNIDSAANIGPGLFIMHASFINIGPGVKIGRQSILAHQNSISASSFYNSESLSSQAPIIGDYLVLGGGAMIEGPIVLGNHVQVSMNALVDKSFGDDVVLFGVPAKNVAKAKAEEV